MSHWGFVTIVDSHNITLLFPKPPSRLRPVSRALHREHVASEQLPPEPRVFELPSPHDHARVLHGYARHAPHDLDFLLLTFTAFPGAHSRFFCSSRIRISRTQDPPFLSNSGTLCTSSPGTGTAIESACAVYAGDIHRSASHAAAGARIKSSWGVVDQWRRTQLGESETCLVAGVHQARAWPRLGRVVCIVRAAVGAGTSVAVEVARLGRRGAVAAFVRGIAVRVGYAAKSRIFQRHVRRAHTKGVPCVSIWGRAAASLRLHTSVSVVQEAG